MPHAPPGKITRSFYAYALTAIAAAGPGDQPDS
jgi:hypothetical protein